MKEQTAAATGRLTSSNPNLQAVPKHEVSLKSHLIAYVVGPTTLHPDLLLRSPYVSRPGYTFLAADFQHIEFRLFAHLAQDPTLLQVFQQPEDIFITLAQLLGETLEPEDREKTKRIVYSVMYGAGAGKLAEFLQVDNAVASRIINSFMVKFPTIRSFFNLVVAKCRRDGKLHTIGGRQRLFPNIKSSNGGLRAQAERQAINFVIQGSAADLCKSAMLRVEQRLGSYPDLEAHLLLQIHDELVYEVQDSQLQQIKVSYLNNFYSSISKLKISNKFIYMVEKFYVYSNLDSCFLAAD
uniref:(California timema) hypothetical protein n=1 Tax=Timema californicum TaxID=61474 RepID=A0A7R9P339_TIMCA|nr:unnamed protein product [Timema californicum]